MSDAEYQVRRQTEAAKALIILLKDSGTGDDAELVDDAIEGETGLKEALAAALDEIDECEVLAVGCKAKEEMFASRRAAAEARAERVRGLIEQALVAIDLAEPMRLVGATLSLTKRPRQAVITNEADIPAKFFTEQPRPAPKLDKRALLAALNEIEAKRAATPEGEAPPTPIPGATLDNGSVSLSVRRK